MGESSISVYMVYNSCLLRDGRVGAFLHSLELRGVVVLLGVVGRQRVMVSLYAVFTRGIGVNYALSRGRVRVRALGGGTSTAQRGSVCQIAIIKDIMGFLLLIFGFFTNVMNRDTTVLTSTMRSLSSFVASVVIVIFIHVSTGPRSRKRSCNRNGCRALTATVVNVFLLFIKFNVF